MTIDKKSKDKKRQLTDRREATKIAFSWPKIYKCQYLTGKAILSQIIK